MYKQLLVSMLTWLCPAPGQCSLPCLLIKLLSNGFLEEGSLFCVHEGIRRRECSNWSQAMGQRARMFVLPENGMSTGLRVSV